MTKYGFFIASALVLLHMATVSAAVAWTLKAETTITPGQTVTIHCKEPVMINECDRLVVSPNIGGC